ncbi:myosin light chain kinase, smooth muscle-like, partial [Saccostrea cucullata]|uniref:myosin light chain kinase, smooth muscle-like n=1 Tax=Saccostrea cuccullata TaxID=36930 RepID=UPI002ED3EA2D
MADWTRKEVREMETDTLTNVELKKLSRSPGDREPDEDCSRKSELASIRAVSVHQFYDIFEELGRGAFGVVHRSIEKDSGRKYLARFISTPCPVDKATVKNEIRIISQLHHPSIVHLKEAFEENHEMILIMEFLYGEDLFTRIGMEDYRTEADVIKYIQQICEGLKHMHENNIVHLDLKPENIVCDSINPYHLKMIELGLAAELKPGEIVKVTTANAGFAAPEIVDSEPIGFYTDMWAVGVLSYALLSGFSPFAGEDDLKTRQNVSRCVWDFSDQCFTEVSLQSKDFIRRLLVRNPYERMSVHESLDHAWLVGDLATRTTQIAYTRYDAIMPRIREQYLGWPQPLIGIGGMANFSSLRRLHPKEYHIHDAEFDHKEAAPKFLMCPRNVSVKEG